MILWNQKQIYRKRMILFYSITTIIIIQSVHINKLLKILQKMIILNIVKNINNGAQKLKNVKNVMKIFIVIFVKNIINIHK